MDRDCMSAAELKAECYRKLLSYKESLTSRQLDLIIYALETYLTLTEEAKEVYQRLISEVYPEVSKLVINPLVEQRRKLSLQESIHRILSHRFPKLPEDLQEKISALTDVKKLQTLLGFSKEKVRPKISIGDW